MNFRRFFESDEEGRKLLSAHFQNPLDDDRLHVFADWLEEHGSPLADWLRHTLTGHEPSGAAEWGRKQEAFFRRIEKDIRHIRFVGDGQFIISPSAYRLGPTGIEKRVRVRHYRESEWEWRPLPVSKWTRELVEAATFMLIGRLSRQPPLRSRDDKPSFGRPASLAERQLLIGYYELIEALNGAAAQAQANNDDATRSSLRQAELAIRRLLPMMAEVQRRGGNLHLDVVARVEGLILELEHHLVVALPAFLTSFQRRIQEFTGPWLDGL